MQPNTVHAADFHHSATCCATVAERPRWVTFANVDALGDHELEARVPQQLTRDRYRDGAEPDDLADLVTLDRPASERGVVDLDDGAASGSIFATNAAKNSSISRTSSANERRVDVAVTMRRTLQKG